MGRDAGGSWEREAGKVHLKQSGFRKASWRRYFIRVMGKGLNYGLSRERAPQEEGPGNAEF